MDTPRPIPINSSQSSGDAFMRPDEHSHLWCTGYPIRRPYLKIDAEAAPRVNLAGKPKLDDLLAATTFQYNDHKCLPLTAKTIHRLSKYWKDVKPISDFTILKCVMITHEINDVHADHVVATLERFSQHCKHLLVISPIKTSEFGSVFNREADNITSGNDWDRILACLPNLTRLDYVHSLEELESGSYYTCHSIHDAVSRRQNAQDVLEVSFNTPPRALTDSASNTIDATGMTILSYTTT